VGRKWSTVSDSSVSSGRRTSPSTFYRQVVAELRKVVWPTRQQLITYFWVVLVFVVVVMTFVSLLDLGFGKLAFEIFA
jgi:preprotein translocase subunit SecE